MSIPNNWGDWRPTLTPHTGNLQATDLIECTMIVGGNPVNTAITGAQIIASSGSVTPYAMTKVDDTNVTLTLGGTPTTSLLQATSLTLGWTGTLADTRITSATTWNAKQAALVSGVNIKTINSISILGSGDIPISSGLTVGTTAIASGTIGGILFQNGSNLLGQDPAFSWDNTNKRLGVGATPSTSVRLDVRSQGALSTDIGFRVRNSANTLDAFKVQGNNEVNVRSNLSLGLYNAGTTRKLYMVRDAETFGIDCDWSGTSTIAARIINSGGGNNVCLLVSSYNGTSNNAIQVSNGDISLSSSAGTKIGITNTEKLAFWNKTPIIQPTTGGAASIFLVGVGTATTDASTFDGYTMGQVVKALRNTGLLA